MKYIGCKIVTKVSYDRQKDELVRDISESTYIQDPTTDILFHGYELGYNSILVNYVFENSKTKILYEKLGEFDSVSVLLGVDLYARKGRSWRHIFTRDKKRYIDSYKDRDFRRTMKKIFQNEARYIELKRNYKIIFRLSDTKDAIKFSLQYRNNINALLELCSQVS